MKLSVEHCKRKTALSIIIFTQICCNFGDIRYVSNVANFELTEINNIFKCLGGFNELKVRTLRGREYLENVRKRTMGGRPRNR